MNGLLVRIGIDKTYGRWNAPVDLDTGDFLYIPIPDDQFQHQYSYKCNCQRDFFAIEADVQAFASRHRLDVAQDLRFPPGLWTRPMHLDPDFSQLTYGDDQRRGAPLVERGFGPGDFLVFYASLKPLQRCNRLCYAIIGFFEVEAVNRVRDLPSSDTSNAHTRWENADPTDIVVRGKRDSSGRLKQCIPIGSFYNKAYRVTPALLQQWGGIDVRNGYIQRSLRLVRFSHADRFYEWFCAQAPRFIEQNNIRCAS